MINCGSCGKNYEAETKRGLERTDETVRVLKSDQRETNVARGQKKRPGINYRQYTRDEIS